MKSKKGKSFGSMMGMEDQKSDVFKIVKEMVKTNKMAMHEK